MEPNRTPRPAGDLSANRRGRAPLALAPRTDAPIGRQVASALREAVLSSQLPPGTRLASTRELARQLDVSRNTILDAYGQLLSEGYFEARTGSGTFVARHLPVEPVIRPQMVGAGAPPRLSASGRQVVTAHALAFVGRPRPFSPGLPLVDQTFLDTWCRVASRARRRVSGAEMTQGDPEGYAPLRRAIASYVAGARGIRCSSSNVFVCAGAQLGIALATRLLVDPDERVWMEDPGYLPARAALTASGATLIPVPVDADGMDVDRAIRRDPQARLAYVSPSHQYPLGVVMSGARRARLLEWSAAANAWVIEDDYDSEFRFSGRPLPALQSLDTAGRVLHIGTFSQLLFPELRLAYLIVPDTLIEPFTTAFAVLGLRAPVADQAILTEFIEGGYLSRHLRRLRRHYASAREAIEEAARRHLAGALEVQGAAVGLHVVGYLDPPSDDCGVSERAAAIGISAPALSGHHFGTPARSGLVLGYGHLHPAAIVAAIERLASAIYMPQPRHRPN